jgi:hypothetical protein
MAKVASSTLSTLQTVGLIVSGMVAISLIIVSIVALVKATNVSPVQPLEESTDGHWATDDTGQILLENSYCDSPNDNVIKHQTRTYVPATGAEGVELTNRDETQINEVDCPTPVPGSFR